MNILMIYPKFTSETFWEAKISLKEIWHRRALMPPLGLLTIASYLPEDFQIRLIDRHIAEETEEDWEWADVVFLSGMIVQLDDYRICVANAKKNGKPVAVGGPLTHAIPEIVTEDADWVCFGEAEDIMEEFVDDLRADRRGKQYQGSNKTNMEEVKIPRFDLVPQLREYAMMPIQFSRGCPFNCEFCDIIEIYGRVPRAKRPAQILAELIALQQLGFKGMVFLVDDNFIGNKRKAKALLEELAVWGRDSEYPFRFITEATLNLADEEELLNKMAAANFASVFIGIETPDPKLLETAQKMQNIPGDPLQKLRKIRDHGIHISAGFIVGFDGEEREVFAAQKSFIQASGIGISMINLLGAIPNTALTRRLEKEGRLLPLERMRIEGSVYELNFIPKGKMTRREYLEGYVKLVKEIYTPQAFFDRIFSALLTIHRKMPQADYQMMRSQGVYFLRIVYLLGISAKKMRAYFWKTLLTVMWKNPGALAAFSIDCYYFYHLNRHADYVAHTIEHYLSNPSPDDVLDTVIPENVDTVTAA